MKSSQNTLDARVSAAKTVHVAVDKPVEACAEEIESIRTQLGAIERMLAALFGSAYNREAQSLESHAITADLIERHFEEVVAEWCAAVAVIFRGDTERLERAADLKNDLSNALVRFIAHLRDPDDIQTYVYLRRHCQEGMLSRAKPAEFDTIHIALKQALLTHVRAELKGSELEMVRDTVVAAIDERRLMVSAFYIESRERALRASEEKYRNSIDHAPDPIYEVDPETATVLAANSAAQELHRQIPERSDKPLVGMTLLEMSYPGEEKEVAKRLRTILKNGSDQILDVPLAGRYFDLNAALVPFGNQQFIQMILHDVTQRREMLDELLKAERLAAAGTFAAGVAHEVNNPLASISSLVQSLLSGETEPTRRMTLHTILSQITRISSTLKDLVNFARPSAAQRKPVDLNQIVTETLRLLTYNKGFTGITLEPLLAPDLYQAFADANEIQQVLLNLLFNAADATQRDGGLIRIITENKAGTHSGEPVKRVIIRVVDNGIGIPRQNLERIFDPFFTTKPAGAGTGLGLSLCQRIVLANRGAIKVTSELGKGTAITISLPAYEPPETQMEVGPQ